MVVKRRPEEEKSRKLKTGIQEPENLYVLYYITMMSINFYNYCILLLLVQE